MKRHLCLIVALLMPVLLVIPTPISMAGDISEEGLISSNSSQSDENQLLGSNVFEGLTAQLIGSRIQLAWRMNTSLDVAYFAIEKSGPNHSFGFIGGLNINKSVHSQEVFRFVDLQESATQPSLYRIKLVLSDGQKIYSSPVRSQQKAEVKAYLDPSSDILSLTPPPSSLPFSVQVLDRIGNPANLPTSYPQQTEKLQVRMGHLADGVYVVRVQSGSKVWHTRVLKR